MTTLQTALDEILARQRTPRLAGVSGADGWAIAQGDARHLLDAMQAWDRLTYEDRDAISEPTWREVQKGAHVRGLALIDDGDGICVTTLPVCEACGVTVSAEEATLHPVRLCARCALADED